MPGNNDTDFKGFDAKFERVVDNHTMVDTFSRPPTNPGDIRQVWQVALRDLYAQLERHEYDSWIKNLSLVELNQGQALITAPSTYACRRLESDYREVVRRALSGVVGQVLNVQFTVEAP